MKREAPIFSGEYSRDMWKAINTAKTIKDCRDAMYFICCRLQEFESRCVTKQTEGGGEITRREL